MRNRHLLRIAALIGALLAASACTAPQQIPLTSEHLTPRQPVSTTASTFSLRVSSEHTVRADHYDVPPDYDNNIALHPYTSGLGPCPHGGPGKVNCSSDMLPASHYNY